MEFPSGTRATCLGTINLLSPALPSPTPPSPKDTTWHLIIESGKQLQPNSSHSIGKMARATQLTSSANIGSLQLCGPCSSLAPQTDPKRSPTRRVTRYQDQISVRYTRWTLRMPSFTRAPHAQPSLSNFTRRDSDFGEPTRSCGTTRLERNFPTSPQNKKTKLTHRSLYMSLRTISTPHAN